MSGDFFHCKPCIEPNAIQSGERLVEVANLERRRLLSFHKFLADPAFEIVVFRLSHASPIIPLGFIAALLLEGHYPEIGPLLIHKS
jgi:hypothetical protein